MPAIQIPQGTTGFVLTAPALILSTVTTDEVIFIGPGISQVDAVTTALPFTIPDPPTGWAVQVTSAVTADSATFTLTVPLTATVSTNGGYNLTYFDNAGNEYSIWFDVILAGTVPVPEVPVQLLQGQASPLTIPFLALSYKSAFISLESPTAGTWLDDGDQSAYPYAATFIESPAPPGWGVTLNSLNSGVSYQSTITIPASFALGVYVMTVGDGHGKIYEREFQVIPAPPSSVGLSVQPCACTTGFDIVSEVQVLLGESLSTTAQQQSMLYPRHVARTLDEIARKTWSLFDTAVCDIIAGQAEYVMPHRPYELRSVCANDGNGNIYPLAALTVQQADDQFYNWQNTSTPGPLWTGVPGYYINEINKFWLLPVPNYNQQAGLIVRGYFGVDLFYTLDMCIPLPEGYQECVVMGTAYRRCREMKPRNSDYAAMMADYDRDYHRLLNRLYAESIRRTSATRNSIPSSGRQLSYWSGGWYWSTA